MAHKWIFGRQGLAPLQRLTEQQCLDELLSAAACHEHYDRKDLRCLESHDSNHGLRDSKPLANQVARFESDFKDLK